MMRITRLHSSALFRDLDRSRRIASHKFHFRQSVHVSVRRRRLDDLASQSMRRIEFEATLCSQPCRIICDEGIVGVPLEVLHHRVIVDPKPFLQRIGSELFPNQFCHIDNGIDLLWIHPLSASDQPVRSIEIPPLDSLPKRRPDATLDLPTPSLPIDAPKSIRLPKIGSAQTADLMDSRRSHQVDELIRAFRVLVKELMVQVSEQECPVVFVNISHQNPLPRRRMVLL